MSETKINRHLIVLIHIQQWQDVMTEDEAIQYLRLDTIKGLTRPADTLARYRAAGLLKGTQVSKQVFYRRVELDRFLEQLTNENRR